MEKNLTNQEYTTAYRKARKDFLKELLRQRRILARTFNAAADETAALVRSAELAGRSSLTVGALSEINAQLETAVADIAQATTRRVEDSITRNYRIYAEIDAEYVADAAAQAGITAVTRGGMQAVGVAVNQRLITNVITRLYSDGVNFSERVWQAGAVYQESIKEVLLGGLSINRDLFTIAKDIQVYTKDGKVALLKRYGALERGTAAFTRRIPRNVDWRAVRLVRSELYNSLQAAAIEQGHVNPGATGVYEWRLTPGVQHDCVCIGYAETKFFKEEDVPEYPHPQCACVLIPVLRPQAELLADLRAWDRGETVPEINNWFNNVYLPAQRV